MTLLAIDTSASLCAAALFDGTRELGREVIDIGKGHAERLMGVIEAALSQAGKSYADLTRIGVAIGPGSFTGIRVGVATARGLALGSGAPAIGVSNLEAVAAAAAPAFPGRPVMAAFTATPGFIHAAIYEPSGNVVYSPATMLTDAALALALRHDAVVAGTAAASLAALDPRMPAASAAATADIAVYARLATLKPAGERPKPLYMREPDAKPQAGFVLPRAGS